MQQVVYADVLIFLNMVITFFLLLTVKAFAGASASAGRLVLASFVGGAYSLVLLAPKIHFLLLLLAKAGMCVSITFLAFRARSAKKMLRCTALFLAVSFLYAGVMYAFSYFFGTSGLIVNNGAAYFPLSVPALIALCSAVYGVLWVLRRTVFRVTKDDMLYDVTVKLLQREICITALMDSGSSLRDIYTGSPVMVLTSVAAASLTGTEIPSDAAEVMSRNGDVPFRLLPVSALSAQKLLPAFTADEVLVSGERTEKRLRQVSVAVTADGLGAEKYQALISEDFI